MSIALPSRRSTLRLARVIAALAGPGDLVVLDGPLGSGKTFLVRGVLRALGLPESVPVTSPTFTLVCEYETHPPVAHADLYRISTDSEVRALGLDSGRGDGRVVLVEWGRPFIESLGGDALIVEFEATPRRATLVATGPRSRLLVRAAGEW